MLGDPWPEEPQDPFPKYGDPEPVEDAVSPELRLRERDVPTDVLHRFWALVAVFNVGTFGAATGLMLVGFREVWYYGGLMTLIGVLTCAYGVRRYRHYQRQLIPDD